MLLQFSSSCAQPGLGRAAHVRARVAVRRVTAGADAGQTGQLAAFERLLAASGTASLVEMRPAVHQNGLFTSRAVKKGEVRDRRCCGCHAAMRASQPSCSMPTVIC